LVPLLLATLLARLRERGGRGATNGSFCRKRRRSLEEPKARAITEVILRSDA
jgi:hypothetical protein